MIVEGRLDEHKVILRPCFRARVRVILSSAKSMWVLAVETKRNIWLCSGIIGCFSAEGIS